MRVASMLAGLLICAAAGHARAAPITYNFTGTVTALSLQPVSIGQTIAISLTLDPSYPSTQPQPGIRTYGGTFAASAVLAATFNGSNVVGSLSTVTLQDNVGGVSRISINSASQLTDSGFSLVFTTTAANTVDASGLPASIDPLDFQSATFRRTVVFDQLFYAGTIDAVPVPAPGAASLAAGALATLLARRRAGRRREQT